MWSENTFFTHTFSFGGSDLRLGMDRDKDSLEKMRASIEDVAAHAKTSAMTVSNVMRGRTNKVSEATRQRVLEAIRELKYVPVQSAMQNRHIETHVIGLVFDQLDITQSFTAFQTYRGLQLGARQYGYDLMTLLRLPSAWMAGQEEDYFRDRRCDGFVFINPYKRQRVLESLVAQKIPAVACYASEVPPGIASIVPDDLMAMRLAVQHLKAHGHSKIAHVTGATWHSDMKQRVLGFQQAMTEAGFESHAGRIIEGADESWQIQLPPIEEMLDGGVTALVCGIDELALAVWRRLEEAGIDVPGDISIVGVDGTTEGAARGLTSIANPFQEVGFSAVESVCRLMQAADSTEVSKVLPVELREGRSVKKLEV